MQLPKEKQEPSQEGFKIGEIVVIYGAPGCGKSTLISSIPDCLILATETHGYERISCEYAPIKINSLSELKEALSLVKDTDRFEWVAIDTIDRVYNWVENKTIQDLGIKEMGKKSYGLDWALARNKFLKIVRWLRTINRKIILAGHQYQLVLSDSVGKSREIDLPGKCSRFFTAEVDIIGRMYVQGGTRYISFEEDPDTDIKTHHPYLSGQVVELPKETGWEVIEQIAQGN